MRICSEMRCGETQSKTVYRLDLAPIIANGLATYSICNLLRAAAKNRWILNQVKTHPTSPVIGLNALCLFLPDKPRYTRFCLLCMTFNCFLAFFSQCDVRARGDPFHPPHPTLRHTSNTRVCLLRGGRTKLLRRRIDRAYLGFGAARTTVCGYGANWHPYVVCMNIGGGV